jgi:hypothetical protein
VNIGQERQLLFLQQLGDASISRALGTWYGNLGHDDLVSPPLRRSDSPARAHTEAAASGSVGLDYALARFDRMPPVWKIRAGYELDQLLDRRVGMLDEMQQREAISPMLCGGIEVAMPTAMPAAPLASRLGKRRRHHHTGSGSSPS